MKKHYWFSYHAPTRERPRAKSPEPYRWGLHQLRDGAAFAEISAILGQVGYVYAGAVLNLPQAADDERIKGLTKTPPLSEWSTRDILVCPTRPPMDDVDQGDKRQISLSHTGAERTIHSALRVFFQKCSRTHLKLTPTVARQLRQPLGDRAEIVFTQYGRASYKRSRALGTSRWVVHKRGNLTAGVIASLPSVWSRGPRFLAVFGFGGLETAIWARIVATRESARLRQMLRTPRPRLTIAEFSVPTISTGPPETLAFADGAHVRILLDATL